MAIILDHTTGTISVGGNGVLTLSGVPTATSSVSGFFSAVDKAKLDTIASGAQVNAVNSVFGRTGTIVSANGDYNGTQITYTPSGNISATTVSAALAELDTEKAALAGATFTGQIKLPDGTVTAPSLTLTNVTNGGIYTPNASLGNVRIQAGLSSGGDGGSMVVFGGLPTEGSGGSVNIRASNGVTATSTSRDGGTAFVTGGSSTIAGTAGGVTLTAGAGGTTSIGGTITLTGGAGGTTSGNGGPITFTGGTATDGVGGTITIASGTSAGTNRAGANISINASASTGSGTGGHVLINGGDGGGSGFAGDVRITSGAAGTGGTAGEIIITGGAASGTSQNAGTVRIIGGSGGSNNDGANVVITAGNGVNGGSFSFNTGTPNNGKGGDFFVTARAGVGTNKDGGSIGLTAGNATGSGSPGYISLTPGSGEKIYLAGPVVVGSGGGYYNLPTVQGTAGYYLKTGGDGSTSWAAVGPTITSIKTANYTASPNEIVRYKTTSGAFTITLPNSGGGRVDGSVVEVVDFGLYVATNNLTIGRNGSSIAGSATDFIIDTSPGSMRFMYSSADDNWTPIF